MMRAFRHPPPCATATLALLMLGLTLRRAGLKGSMCRRHDQHDRENGP
jgi:hypothetical protein